MAMETSSDPGMCLLMVAIEEGFPDKRRETESGRHSCSILDVPREPVCLRRSHPISGGNSFVPSQRGTANFPFSPPGL